MKGVFLALFLTLPLIPAEEPVISGNHQFTAELCKELSKLGDDNFLVSPFSAEIALALVQSGAKGQTREELRTALHLPDYQNPLELKVPNLKSKDDVYVFHAANRLYLNENFSIKDEFKEVATAVFGTDLEKIDFSRNVEAAGSINQWVEKQTENKIHNLIGEIAPDTKAILINALYLKANWALPFIAKLTKKKDFYRIDNKVVKVDTMRRFDPKKPLNYAENEKLRTKFLEVPFKGEDISMGFVLPNDNNGIANLEKQINQVFLPQSFTKEFVNMSFPKFKIETTVDFKKALQNLGVTQAFTRGQADFTGITDDESLIINKIIQKTFINVDEAGVEAAAASTADFQARSGIIMPTNVKQFHADHPFIYYIKIKNLIVFAGKVGMPSY